MNLPPIATILSNLEAIANQVRTNFVFCRYMKEQLQGCGYDWCNMFVGDDDEQVMKVLAVAVNEAIQKKVYLGNQNSSVVNQELHQLLLDNDDNKSLDQFFFLNVAPPPSQDVMLFMPWTGMLQGARSPLNMAEYLRRSALQWLIKKIIEHQFDIRWNTQSPNGEPSDYTFYEFCDKENTTKHFKYIPRLAHVKATLYKESRRTSVYYLRNITKEELCPIVYIRTVQGWISWQADNEGEFNGVNIENDFSWINPSIRKFITENADEQIFESLEDSLKKPTLYWAVLNDTDFVPGDKLKLKPIGRTQVYVGKANKGIRGRWMKDSDNHCEMMKNCLDNVCAMTTYDPLRLEGIQLVDARLALAKVRGEYSALFVIKTFGDDGEKAEIAQQKATTRLDEAQTAFDNAKARPMGMPTLFSYAPTQTGCFNTTLTLQEALSLVSLQDTPSTLDQLEAEVEERQEELDEAIAAVNDLNDSKTSKAEAEALLTQAEKLHRKGKRVHDSRKNIIPYKDYRMTWKPTNMACGMNKN